MPGRYTGVVGKSFSGDRDKARSRQGAAQVLVQSLVDRIKNSPMKGRGLLTGKKYLADGSTVWAMVNMIGIVPVVRTWVECPVGVGGGETKTSPGFYMIMYYRNGGTGAFLTDDGYSSTDFSPHRLIVGTPDTAILSSVSQLLAVASEPMYAHPEYAKHFIDGGSGTVLCAFSGDRFVYKKYVISDKSASAGEPRFSKYNTDYYDQWCRYDESIGTTTSYKLPHDTGRDTITDGISLYYLVRTHEPDSGLYAIMPIDENGDFTGDGYSIPIASKTRIYSLGVTKGVSSDTAYHTRSMRCFGRDGSLLFNSPITDLIGSVSDARLIGTCCYGNDLFIAVSQHVGDVNLPRPYSSYPKTYRQIIHIYKLGEVNSGVVLVWQATSSELTEMYPSSTTLPLVASTLQFGVTDSALHFSPLVAANSSYYAVVVGLSLLVGDATTGAVIHVFDNPLGANVQISSMAFNRGVLWAYTTYVWSDWATSHYKLVGLSPSKWKDGDLGTVFEISQSDLKTFLGTNLPLYASDFQLAGCTLIQNPIGGDAQ